MLLHLATSSKLRRSSAYPFGWRLLLFFAATSSCTSLPSDWAVSAEHQCMVADLTGQPLLEQVPQRKFWKLGLSPAYRVTCEQISGCTTDVLFRCEFGVRLPGDRCARCIDERPLIELCSNMSSNVGSQGQATSASTLHSVSPVSNRIRTCRTVMKYYCSVYCVLSWECHGASTLCPSPSCHGTYLPNVL